MQGEQLGRVSMYNTWSLLKDFCLDVVYATDGVAGVHLSGLPRPVADVIIWILRHGILQDPGAREGHVVQLRPLVHDRRRAGDDQIHP